MVNKSPQKVNQWISECRGSNIFSKNFNGCQILELVRKIFHILAHFRISAQFSKFHIFLSNISVKNVATISVKKLSNISVKNCSNISVTNLSNISVSYLCQIFLCNLYLGTFCHFSPIFIILIQILFQNTAVPT